MELFQSVLVSLSIIVLLLLLKKLFALITYGYVIFRDYYVLWNIAFGAHPTRRKLSHPMRLHTYVCNPKLLDNVSMEELYTFAKSMVSTSSGVNSDTFRRVLLTYDRAIILRERLDGSLRGMSLLGKDVINHKGQKVVTLKFGLAFCHNYYQGGPYLYYVIIYHIMKALICHRTSKVYILSKLFSYKSYVSLINMCKQVYPIHDKEIPEFEKDLLQRFAMSICFDGETYNPETFILEREMSRVKSHVAKITTCDLENPHIRFFAERNPGWTKGHCLFCISEVTWTSLIKAIWKSIKRAIKGRKGDAIDKLAARRESAAASRESASRLRRHFDRHLSFQDVDAKIQVLDNYTIQDGHAVLRTPVENSDIYVSENDENEETMSSYWFL